MKNEKHKETKEVISEKNVKTPVNLDKEVKKAEKSSDKVIIFIIVGICILIALLVFGFVFYKSNYEAVVSTDYGIVNKAEYTVYYKMFAPMLEYYGYTASQIPETIANKAGTDKIILAKAKAANISLSDKDKEAIEKVFSDKDQLEQWKNAGINTAILRKLYEEDYIISTYIEKIGNDATNEEMLKYLKDTYGDSANLYEYNTRHILVKTTKTSDDGSSVAMSDEEKNGAREKAINLLNRAKAGEDFETLAKENSEDTGTAVNGGKFTFYDGDSVLEQYKNVAMNMAEGQIYDGIVETSVGYHIIKLDTKVENGKVNSKTERNSYANEIINGYSTTENIEIKTDILNKLIESITGTKTTTNTTDNNSQVVSSDDSTNISTENNTDTQNVSE